METRNHVFFKIIGSILWVVIFMTGCQNPKTNCNKTDGDGSVSYDLFQPSLYVSGETIKSLGLEEIKQDIPQYQYQREDTTIIFTLSLEDSVLTSQGWFFPIEGMKTSKSLEEFLLNKGLRIISNYKEVQVDLDTGEEKVQYIPNALEYFAVQSSDKWIFICRKVEIEDSLYLAIEFNFPKIVQNKK